MRKRSRARELALILLYQIDMLGIKKEDVSESIETFWEQNQIEKDSVKEFASMIVSEVVKNYEVIDVEITLTAFNWTLNRMSYVDRNILRIATFELIFMPDIPPLATINEAIELAKRYGTNESSKFINGILHKIKEKVKITPSGNNANKTKRSNNRFNSNR